MDKPRRLFEYVGVMHIHTTDSDGSKTHDEIIELAHKYELDFLAFSDHMTLEHKNKEGWYGKTLVIVGYEHQDIEEKSLFSFRAKLCSPRGFQAEHLCQASSSGRRFRYNRSP